MKYSGVEWLGKIPHDWEVLKAKRIFKLKNEKNSELKPLLSVSKGRGLLLREEMVNRPTHAQKNIETFKLVGDGDFVIHLRSFQSGFELSSIEGAVSPAYTVFNARKNDEVCNKYYKYIFYSKPFIDKIASTTLSLRDGKPISYDDFSITLLPVPNYIEQQKIAAFLDEKVSHIDNIIEDTKKSIENLKTYKQSLITETVTKGLDPNIEMKDSGIEWIGDIPNNWSVIPLKYISSLNDENLSNKTSEDYSFKYVDIGSVSFENGIEQMEETNFKSSPSRARRIVRKNDIIISTVRTYLKAIALIKESNDIIVSTGFAVVRPKNYLVDPLFLSYSLKSDYFTEKVRAYSYGIAYPSINSTEIATMEIVLPPKSIQIEIACFLRERIFQIDSLINEKDKLITKLESYKKSLIYEYVTGKKEVK